jgi:PAS domain S-box-containing protein
VASLDAHPSRPEEFFEVADMSNDNRFCSHRIVTSEHHVRFFASAPLVTEGGQVIGSLVVLDRISRTLTEGQREALRLLGKEIGQRPGLEDAQTSGAFPPSGEKDLWDTRIPFEALVNNLNAIVWVADSETLAFEFVSDHAEMLLGYRVEDWIADESFWRNHIHEEDREWVLNQVASSNAATHDSGFEFRMIAADGRTVWMRNSVSVSSSKNRRRRLQGVMIDVTERRLADEALKENEKRLRITFDQAAVGIAHIAPDGRCLSVNQRLSEMVGFDPEELKGKSFYEISHPADLESDLEYHERMINGEIQSYSVEKRYIRKDKSEVWINLSLSLVPGEHGEDGYFIAVVKDVTERRMIEDALKQSERDYHGLFEHAHDAIIIVDPTEEIVLEVNQRASELYGFDRSEFVGRSMRELSVEPAREAKALLEVLHESRKIKFESIQRRMDGTMMYMEIIAAAIEYRGKEAILSVNRDVSEARRAQEALRESEEQLRQSQKMEAVGRLAGGVAHDFNNLLAAIMLHSDLMRRQLTVGDPILRRVDEIRKASDRAASLTHQLLAFSRKQVLQPKVLDLNITVAEMNRMLQRLIGEDIELHPVLEPNLGHVKADPSQIEQVIMNLVVNARDAMPKGGKLILETKNVYLDEVFSKHHQPIQPGRYVRLDVTDSGCGMDAETLARIFEPFFTTKEQGKGTGLGLSMVYGIIQQSGGNIWVRSEPDKGTTFNIFLPRIDDDVSAHRTHSPESQLVTGKGRILLVEDEEMVRTVAREILHIAGYEVLEASNAGEALLFCERYPGQIDLMLTDVVMPQLSGVDLAARIRPLCPGMRVLYMSGYTFDTVTNHGVLVEGASFLEKPFTPVTLSRKVREVLDEPADS